MLCLHAVLARDPANLNLALCDDPAYDPQLGRTAKALNCTEPPPLASLTPSTLPVDAATGRAFAQATAALCSTATRRKSNRVAAVLTHVPLARRVPCDHRTHPGAAAGACAPPQATSHHRQRELRAEPALEQALFDQARAQQLLATGRLGHVGRRGDVLFLNRTARIADAIARADGAALDHCDVVYDHPSSLGRAALPPLVAAATHRRGTAAALGGRRQLAYMLAVVHGAMGLPLNATEAEVAGARASLVGPT